MKLVRAARRYPLLFLAVAIGPIACGENDSNPCGGCYGGMPHDYYVGDQWQGDGSVCVLRDDGSTVCSNPGDMWSLNPNVERFESEGDNPNADADSGAAFDDAGASPPPEDDASSDAGAASSDGGDASDDGGAASSDRGDAASQWPVYGLKYRLALDWSHRELGFADVWVCPSRDMWLPYAQGDRTVCTNDNGDSIPSTHLVVPITFRSESGTWSLQGRSERVQIDLASRVAVPAHEVKDCY